MRTSILRNSLLGLFVVSAFVAQSQNVAINSTGNTAVNGTILDLSNNLTNSTYSFLAPYVSLTNVNVLAPVTGAGPSGLLVYNTNAAVTGGNGAGYYYWNGTMWVYLYNSGAGGSLLTGADDGTSVNGSDVILGNAYGGTAGELLQNTEIPFNGFNITFSGATGKFGIDLAASTSAAQALEIGGSANTIRINGVKSGNTFNAASSANTNFLIYANTSGDLYSLPGGTNNQVLTWSSATGPQWAAGNSVVTSYVKDSAWLLTGNTGITASASAINAAANNNFIGTLNTADFVMVADGKERMRIANGTGYVGINTIAPGAQLDVQGINISTQNVVNITANNLTTGSALNVASNLAGTATNGIAHFNFSGAHLGNGVQDDDATVTGKAVVVNANSATTGTGLNVNANVLTTGVGFSVINTGVGLTTTGNLFLAQTGSTGAPTDGLARFDFTGAHTNNGLQVDDVTVSGKAVVVNANSATTGTGLNVNANVLTTGVGFSVINTGVGLTTTGNLFLAQTGSTGAPTNGLARFDFTGAHTNNGLQVDDVTVSGKAVVVNANSATTGTGLNVNANVLTTGVGFSVINTGVGLTTTGNLFLAQTASTGAPTNGLARFSFTGLHTGNGLQVDDATSTGNAESVIANSLTAGTALNVTAGTTLTSGTGLTVTSNAAGLTGSVLLAQDNAASVPLNGLAHFNFAGAHTGVGVQVDDATATGKAVLVNANALTTGMGVSISSISTAGAAAGTTTMLNIARSGANANATHTAIGENVSITNTGATSTNIAGKFSASGATNNYGLIVPNNGGFSGFYTATPVNTLDVFGSVGYQMSTVAVTAATTLDATYSTVLANPTGGAFTITLPTAASAIRRFYTIVYSPSAATGNAVTVVVSGGGNIYTGVTANASIALTNGSVTIQSNGTNWYATTQWYGAPVSYVRDSAWLLTGNAGTTPGTNFLGTTDAQALEFKVKNNESGWIDYTTPFATNFGYQALSGGNTGDYNSAFGYQSMQSNTSGKDNIGIGYQALNQNSVGNDNTAIGYTALANSNGRNNTAVGSQALNTGTGNDNTAVGFQALNSNTARQNTAIGSQSMQYNAGGNFNTAEGYQSLNSNTSGSDNTSNGYEALNQNLSGADNTATGYEALTSNIGSDNTADGSGALDRNGAGIQNTGMGYSALYFNVAGSNNTATGYLALTQNIASDNTAVGYLSLENNTTGTGNTAFGDQALITNGAGNNNTAIGYQANVATSNLTNSTVVGANATVDSSNTVLLGNNAVTRLKFNGSLMPYYGANFHAGSTGQVLTSQGFGVAPQWVTPVATSITASNGLTMSSPTNAILGGTLTQATTITQAGNSLDISGGTIGLNDNASASATNINTGTSTGTVNIGNNTGYTGINNTTPVSTLDVNGSMGMTVQMESASAILDNTGTIWIFNGSGLTATLPAASAANVNRTYYIVSQTDVLTISTGYQDLTNTTQTTIAAGTSIEVVSTGSAWVQFK